jgi:GT2 family glycosyltransferase
MSHDVIVCVHNGGKDVEACLQSLVRHWEPTRLGKLILVDDCSGPEMAGYLAGFERDHGFVRRLRLEQQHYYTRAANAGLAQSDARLRTLLNSDTIVTPGWIGRIQEVFALSPEIGIVGPLSNAASTQSVPFVKSAATQTAINDLPPGVTIDEFAAFIARTGRDVPPPFTPLVHGFCMTISAAVIAAIGMFDEEFFPRGYGEENDFCFRAEDAGFVLSVAVDAFVYHVKSVSYSSAEREAFMRDGMQNLARRHGATRIRAAVAYMEGHPGLQRMRQAVLDAWPEFYRPGFHAGKIEN